MAKKRLSLTEQVEQDNQAAKSSFNTEGVNSFVKDAMGKMGNEYSEEKASKIIEHYNYDYDKLIEDAGNKTGVKDINAFREAVYSKYNFSKPTDIEAAEMGFVKSPVAADPEGGVEHYKRLEDELALTNAFINNVDTYKQPQQDEQPELTEREKLLESQLVESKSDVTNIPQDQVLKPTDPRTLQLQKKKESLEAALIEQDYFNQPKSEDSYIKDVGQSLEKGAAALNQGLARIPSTIYRIGAIPQNLLSNVPGLEGLEVSKDKNSAVLNFLDENKITDYYDEEAKRLGEKVSEYERSVTSQLKHGDILGAFQTLGVQAAETIPLTLALVASGGTGAAVESGVGVGAYATSHKLHQLDENNPDLNESVKMFNSLLTGTTEALSESMSLGSIAIGKKLLYNEGAEGLKALAEKSFVKTFNPVVSKIANVSTPMIGEGLTEAAATYSENYVDYISGVKTDANMMDGVMDSFLVGTVAGGVITAPITTYNEVVTNPVARLKVKNNFGAAETSLNDLTNDSYVEAIKNIAINHNNIEDTKAAYSEVLDLFKGNLSVEEATIGSNYISSSINYQNTSAARRKAIAEEVAPSVGQDGNVTLVQYEGQLHSVRNPQDLGQEGKVVFLTDKEGNVKPVISSKVGNAETKTQEEVIDGAISAQDEQDLAMEAEQQAQEETAALADEKGLKEGGTVETPKGKQTLVSVNPDGTSTVVNDKGEESIVNTDEIEAYKTTEQKAIEKEAEKAEIEGQKVVSEEPLFEGSDIIVTDRANGTGVIQTPEGEQTFENTEERNAMIEALASSELEAAEGTIDDLPPEQAYAQMLETDPEIANEVLEGDIAAMRTQAEASRTQSQETQSRQERVNLLKEAKELEAEALRLEAILADPTILEAQTEEVIEEPATIEEQAPAEATEEVVEETYERTPDIIHAEYQQEKDNAPINQLLPWQEVLLTKTVNPNSFIENSDKANVTPAMQRSWFASKGEINKNLDLIAQEITDETGFEVTEQDIVEFIIDNPTATVRKTTDAMNELQKEYKDVTGESIHKRNEQGTITQEDAGTPFRIAPPEEEVTISDAAKKDLRGKSKIEPLLKELQDEFGVPVKLINSSEQSAGAIEKATRFGLEAIAERTGKPISELSADPQTMATALKIGTPTGYYDQSTGDAVIISDKASAESISRLKKTYLHEGILHKGLDLIFDAGDVTILGETYEANVINENGVRQETPGKDKFLLEVFDRLDDKAISDRASVYAKGQDIANLDDKTKMEIAEEVLATVNEEEVLRQPRLQELLDKLYKFIRKIKVLGLTSNQFTKTELMDVLKQHRELVKQQTGKDTVQVEATGDEVMFQAEPAGQINSDNFKQWFGDSVVVNEDGSPKVVYHGTNADFESFDPKYQTTTAHGYGFYFATDENVAKGYRSEGKGRLIEAYLSINKPLDDEAPNFSINEITQIVTEALNIELETYADEMESYADSFLSNIVDTYSMSQEDAISEAADMLSNNDTAIDMIAELSNIMGSRETPQLAVKNTTGYDGIFVKDFQEDEGDVYIAWFPNQVKSATDNSGEFSRTNPDIRFRVEDTFYSPTEKALTSIKQEKGTVAQFEQMLLKNGAKQAELDWMGFREQFPSVNSKVTKGDIQEWINGNKVQIEEVEKGVEGVGQHKTIEEISEAKDILSQGGKLYAIDSSGQAIKIVEDSNEIASYITDNWDNYTVKEGNIESLDRESPTKYADYQLPGGKNYKELLITMPEKPVDTTGWTAKEGEGDFASGPIWEVRDPDGNWVVGIPSENNRTAQEAIDRAAKMKRNNPENYKSSHFNEKNILAHTRFNERYDNDGNKVLFIEELQSDWAQEGRKKGFKPKVGYIEFRDGLHDKYGTENVDDLKEKMSEQEISKLNELWKEGDESTIPQMPFKKTDQWLNLGLRRMIRYAAENGFDKIAWTTGEQQADRYDLSKSIDEVWIQKSPKKEGYVSVDATKGEEDVFNEIIPVDKLSDYVGKELADKYNNSEDKANKPNELQTYSGLDLKVGGEGMKSFYNQMLPKAANKLGKKFGSKVEPMEMFYTEDFKQLSLPITDKMKQSVMEEGQPMFRVADTQQELEDFVKDSKVKETVYHGSPDARGILADEEYQTAQQRFKEAMTKEAAAKVDDDAVFFFTNSYSTANSYADDRRAMDYLNAEPMVLRNKLNIENPLQINAGNSNWRKYETKLDGEKIKGTRQLVEYAKRKGYDSIIINNVKDNYNNTAKTPSSTVYAVFNNDQILIEPKEDVKFRVEDERDKVETNPSEAQIESGNYKKGHVKFDGFDISIENPKGAIRKGTNEKGEEWSSIMPNDYGYLRGTIGADKDHLDVFLGDNLESDKVYVVDQVNPNTGAFDEHKLLMGYNSLAEAKQSYLDSFEEGWQGLGAITRTTKDGLKEWFKGDTKKPFAPQDDLKFKTKLNNVDVINELPKRFYSRSYSKETNNESWKSFKAKDGNKYYIGKNPRSIHDQFKVVNSEGDDIGTIAVDVKKDKITGYTFQDSIQVNNDYRRLGIGTAMVDYVEQLYNKPYVSSGVTRDEFNSLLDNRKRNDVKFQVKSGDPKVQAMLDKLAKVQELSKTAARIRGMESEKLQALGPQRKFMEDKINLYKEAVDEGKAEATEMIKEVHKTIIDYAKKALPLTEAGAREIGPVMTLIKNSSTPKDIEAAINRIDELAGTTTEKQERRKYVAKTNRLLKWMTGLKKSGTKRVGKFEYEDTKAFQELKEIDKRVSDLTRITNSNKRTAEEKAEADAKLSQEWDNLNEKADKTALDEAIMKLIELRRLGSKASPSLAKIVAEELQDIYEQAKDAKSEADVDAAINRKESKEFVKDFLTTNTALKDKKWFKRAMTQANTFTADIMGNWETLMTMIGGQKLRDKTSLMLNEAQMAIGKQETMDNVLNEAKDIYGNKTRRETLNTIHDLSKEEFELRQPNRKGEEGQGKPSELSKLHLMDIYNATQNEDVAKDYYMSYGDITLSEDGSRDIDAQRDSGKQTIDALLSNLSEQDKALADVMQRELDKYYDKLNEIHIKLYNRDLPRVENYWPSTAEREVDIDVMEQFFADSRHPSSTKERSAHRIPEPRDAFNKFTKHIDEAEWYTNMALPVNDINKTFKDNNVKKLIEDARGENFYKNINEAIANVGLMPPGKQQQSSKLTSWLNPFLNNWVASKIGATPSVPLKQLLSAVNYAENMPTGQWATGFIKTMANPKQSWKEMMEIPYLKTRLGDGYSEAVQRALNGDENVHKSRATNFHTSFKNLMTIGTRYGDIAAIIFGGKPYLDYLMKQEGMTEQEAVDKFMQDTLRSQQAPFSSTLSKLQNSKNPFFRAVFAFSNTPSQYMRKLFEANQNLRVQQQQYKAGKISKEELAEAKKKAIKAHTIYGVVNTVTFTLVGSLISAAMRGSDPDDEIWKDIVNQLSQTYIGGLPVIKDLLGKASRVALDMPVYDKSEPFIEGIDEVVEAGIKLSTGQAKNPAKEYEKIGQGVATMLGVPYYNLKKNIKAIPPFRESTFTTTRTKEVDNKLNELKNSKNGFEARISTSLKKSYSKAKSKATRLRKEGKVLQADRIDQLIEDSKLNLRDNNYNSLGSELRAFDRKLDNID